MEMSELRSLIIALLAFCVPIVAAVVDKRAKAKKQTPQVNAQPIDFEEFERSRRAAAEEGTRSIVRGANAPIPEAAASDPAGAAGAVIPVRTESKPVPAQTKAVQPPQRRQPAVSETNPTAAEIRKDCRKLILYSEILKPKYDDFS